MKWSILAWLPGYSGPSNFVWASTDFPSGVVAGFVHCEALRITPKSQMWDGFLSPGRLPVINGAV